MCGDAHLECSPARRCADEHVPQAGIPAQHGLGSETRLFVRTLFRLDGITVFKRAHAQVHVQQLCIILIRGRIVRQTQVGDVDAQHLDVDHCDGAVHLSVQIGLVGAADGEVELLAAACYRVDRHRRIPPLDVTERAALAQAHDQ